MLEASASKVLLPRLTASAFLAVALPGLDNPGIARYGLGAGARLADFAQLGLELSLAHEEWSTWASGENRASLLATARPLSSLACGLGAAWRVPLSGSNHGSPLAWHGDSPELNLAYRVRWEFLAGRKLGGAAFLANCDGSTFRNPQQSPFGLEFGYTASRQARVFARLGSGLKGLSSLLFSLAELDAHLGVKYDF